jgi:hypothetical protein
MVAVSMRVKAMFSALLSLRMPVSVPGNDLHVAGCMTPGGGDETGPCR